MKFVPDMSDGNTSTEIVAGAPTGAPLLELTGITKSFGGVQALREVDFALRSGEIHGLVGENGAGKSTLMKIIAGVHSHYAGTMKLEGKEVRFHSARDALNAGIGSFPSASKRLPGVVA